MKKPEPRHINSFIDDADEDEHILNSLCSIYAEQMSVEIDMSTEKCADMIKDLVLSGRAVIDVDEKHDRVRLIPAPQTMN
jgi:hypothetical protein